MDKFKASNGIQFERRENGAIVISGGLLDPEFTITPAAASGLRQFFLHERGENTRPWEDAKPGEVWELDGDYYLADAGRFFRLPPVTPSDPSWRPPSFASEFKSGERFYPAGDCSRLRGVRHVFTRLLMVALSTSTSRDSATTGDDSCPTVVAERAGGRCRTVPSTEQKGTLMDDLIERVAAAMFEAPAPDEPDAPVSPWPPKHPDDRAWWITRAQAAINTIKGEP